MHAFLLCFAARIEVSVKFRPISAYSSRLTIYLRRYMLSFVNLSAQTCLQLVCARGADLEPFDDPQASEWSQHGR
jgi:hypothetical protein